MSAPKFCAECGAGILITVRAKASRHRPKTLKGHDLCAACWRELVERAAALAPIVVPDSPTAGPVPPPPA